MPLTGALPEPTEEQAQQAGNAMAMFGMLSGHWMAQIVRTTAKLGIVDHIDSGARNTEQIADAAGTDPATTYRLLRACVGLGLLRISTDTDTNTDAAAPTSTAATGFAVTPLGGMLRRDAPGSLRQTAIAMSEPGHWRSWELLPEAVTKGGSQTQAALGTDMWGHFAEHQQEGALFSGAMSDATELLLSDVLTIVEPGAGSHILDVGGAQGSLVLALLQAHPDTTGAVLDLSTVVGGAASAAGQAGLSDRFDAVAGSFFDAVPSADYYLLKWILHDWSDEQCVQILSHCRESASPHARLLVIEGLIGESSAPGPAALFDLNMLIATQGRERDLTEYDALFAAAGWQRVAMAPTRSPINTLLELAPV